jgi:hypothetical protein
MVKIGLAQEPLYQPMGRRFKHGQYCNARAPGSLIKIGRYHRAMLDLCARLDLSIDTTTRFWRQ